MPWVVVLTVLYGGAGDVHTLAFECDNTRCVAAIEAHGFRDPHVARIRIFAPGAYVPIGSNATLWPAAIDEWLN